MSRFPATTCVDCGTVYGHPPSICRECRSDRLNTTPISGRGTVYASTTIRVPGTENADEAPFAVCVVDVGTDESVRVTARLVDREGSEPGDEVQFVERRNGTFYFETNG